jgi:hypothetical protein
MVVLLYMRLLVSLVAIVLGVICFHLEPRVSVRVVRIGGFFIEVDLMRICQDMV